MELERTHSEGLRGRRRGGRRVPSGAFGQGAESPIMADSPPHSSPDRPAVVRSVADLRSAVQALRAEGSRIALVPTMGALHEGHLSLLRRAAADGHRVVMSIFVNPTQFGAGEDLAAYPRDEARDLALAAQERVALVFAPPAHEVYPEGFATEVQVAGPSEGLEGAARPGHFAGVATVVAKLLLAVRPDRAVFGQKDAQQLAVVRRLMRDLHLDDVELVAGPIVREPDGLAMSSRNAYLGPEDRVAATVLQRALTAGWARATEGETDAHRIEEAALVVLRAEQRCRPDYAAVVDPDSFERLERLGSSALLCIAAQVGPARLIDNRPLSTPTRRTPVPPVSRRMLKSKIHRATVTEADLDYVGSITVDADLLERADIRPYEQVQVVDIANGARFETYAIEGERGSGTICVNGAAARLVATGDLVIVLSYAEYAEEDLERYEPLVVHVDERNRPTGLVQDVVPSTWGSR